MGRPRPVIPTTPPWRASPRATSRDRSQLFEKAVANEPDSAERQESFAKVLYQLERYDDAEPYAVRALELEPDNVEMYMVLYSVYVGMGQLDRAGEALREAEQVAPGDPRIMQQMAYVANESGDTEGAIAAYEGLVEVDPTNTENWLTLAGLYADTGAMDKSADGLQEGRRTRPRRGPAGLLTTWVRC